MNSLLNYGINSDASLSEMEWLITQSNPTSCIFSIRSKLFLDAKESGLVAAGDALVTRRKTNGGKTVRGKHASDICQLVSSIKNKTVIPRTLLRNGKRSKEEFAASQARHQNVPEITDLPRNTTDYLPESTTDQVTADAFHSTVVSNISSLKSSVDSLKEEVQVLKGKLNRDPTIIDDCNTCLIYVHCKHSITETLTKAFLESKLQTETLGML